MQFSTLILPLIAFIPTLVSASACVAGGPAPQVTQAGACCKSQGGTWYQFYAVQAICVVADNKLSYYNGCVSRTCPTLDTKCIPGNGEGLSTAFGTATTYTGPRETITGA